MFKRWEPAYIHFHQHGDTAGEETEVNVNELIELKKQERKALGLHVRIAVDDSIGFFDYYPNSQAQKADYIRKTVARGVKILEQ